MTYGKEKTPRAFVPFSLPDPQVAWKSFTRLLDAVPKYFGICSEWSYPYFVNLV